MPSKIPDRSEETTEKEETQAQPEKEKTSEYRPRVRRACDRCRFMKRKCDGAKLCKACQESDKICVYRTAQDREAKNYVGYILNITEHALIQLYWACRDGTGFPGATIETEDRQVTASAILKALGLKEPGENEPLNNETEASTTVPTYPVQALQREAQTPLLTPEDWMFSATDSTSRIDSKANSTPEMLLTNGQTRRRAPSVGPRQTQRSPTPVDPPFPFHASSMSAGGLPTASNNPDSQISSLTNPTIPHVGLHESPDISFPAPGYAENADNDLLLHFFGPTAAAIMPGYNLGEFDIPPELRLNDDPGSHLPE